MNELPTLDKIATGRRIRMIMDDRHMDVYTLATKMNLRGTRSIYDWINGKMMPSTENLVRLAYALNTDIYNILVIRRPRKGDR